MQQEQILSLIRSALKVIGTALATKGVVAESEADILIGAVVTIIGVFLSWKTHKPAGPASDKTSTQAACLIVAVLLLAGCGTVETRAYKSAAAIATTVDVSRKAWNDYVAAGRATSNQVYQVHKAYTDYQVVMKEFELNVHAFHADGTNNLGSSVQKLNQAAASVVTLVARFKGSTNGPLPVSHLNK